MSKVYPSNLTQDQFELLSDIEQVLAFLQDYLQGSQWARTVELRRDLAQNPKSKMEEKGV